MATNLSDNVKNLTKEIVSNVKEILDKALDSTSGYVDVLEEDRTFLLTLLKQTEDILVDPVLAVVWGP